MNEKATAYINGRVHTMRREGETVEAFAVCGGRFIYCGSNEGAMEAARGGETVDLGGASVLPGLIDVHQHVQAYSGILRKVDLRECRSMGELKARLSARAAVTPKGALIEGVGFNNGLFPGVTMPSRHDLDAAAPEHPVIIQRYCVHCSVANSLALGLGGIGPGYCGGAEGSVEFDACGEPTGVLWEQTAADLTKFLEGDGISKKALADGVEEALREGNSYGITGVHAIQGKLCSLYEQLSVYQTLRDEGRLTSRVYLGYDEMPGLGMKSGLGDDMIKYGFFKIYADGSMGPRSALLSAPYSDEPGRLGVANHSQEELDSLIRAAYDADIQTGVHAIGDGALSMVLSSLEKAYNADPKPLDRVRFRLIHCELVSAEAIERMKKLPVICDIQPTYVSNDMDFGPLRVGEERLKYFLAFKTLCDSFICSGSSDLPVEPINPFLGIYCAVTRRKYDGAPGEDGFLPEERLSRYAAVSLYTRNAAYASFDEDKKGSIEEGKLADFILTDRDVFTVDAFDIQNIRVLRTYLGGKKIYDAARGKGK